MKKRYFLLITLILGVLLALVLGSTYSKTEYLSFRTVVATETTQLTGSTQQTAPNASDDGTIYISPPVGALHSRFLITAAADKTVSWTLWGYKSINDPAKYAAHGTAESGATQTGETNEFYADTLVITDQQWFKTIGIAAGAPDTIVSGGGISELVWDSCEYPYWKIILRDIGGTSPECTAAGAEISSFD